MLIVVNRVLRSDKKPSESVDSIKSEKRDSIKSEKRAYPLCSVSWTVNRVTY